MSDINKLSNENNIFSWALAPGDSLGIGVRDENKLSDENSMFSWELKVLSDSLGYYYCTIVTVEEYMRRTMKYIKNIKSKDLIKVDHLKII
jgi:hypothetical protein